MVSPPTSVDVGGPVAPSRGDGDAAKLRDRTLHRALRRDDVLVELESGVRAEAADAAHHPGGMLPLPLETLQKAIIEFYKILYLARRLVISSLFSFLTSRRAVSGAGSRYPARAG